MNFSRGKLLNKRDNNLSKDSYELMDNKSNILNNNAMAGHKPLIKKENESNINNNISNNSSFTNNYYSNNMSNNNMNNLKMHDPNHFFYNQNHIRRTLKKYTFKTQAGKNENGLTKTNQDSYLLMENILNNEEFKIFGVFDGHGNKTSNVNS